jgi:hypothetical protein
LVISRPTRCRYVAPCPPSHPARIITKTNTTSTLDFFLPPTTFRPCVPGLTGARMHRHDADEPFFINRATRLSEPSRSLPRPRSRTARFRNGFASVLATPSATTPSAGTGARLVSASKLIAPSYCLFLSFPCIDNAPRHKARRLFSPRGFAIEVTEKDEK